MYSNYSKVKEMEDIKNDLKSELTKYVSTNFMQPSKHTRIKKNKQRNKNTIICSKTFLGEKHASLWFFHSYDKSSEVNENHREKT
jgi:hypothetical protein